ncbi:ABC transporter transmembrane domain-containing protein [Agromyces protaetiae]|uniref:ABC transporter transmembrane domain-containing protein n=1 Tax=Agromyces protaetiae TaxID=2509455 RepID=UPI001FB5AFE6|nr:ABC transporter transmembrane domain-containing protein [Agromyces protaetiae]
MTTTPLPVASPADTRRTLGSLLRSRSAALVAASGALLAASVAGLALPAALGLIVDAVVDGDTPRVGALIAAIAGLGVLSAVLTGAGRVLVARLGEGVLAELRGAVVTRLLRLPSTVVERAGRGDLVARAAGDTRIVGDVVSGVLPTFASAAFAIVVTVAGLGVLDWRFALAALAAAPVQAFALRRYLRRSRPVYRDARAAEGERSQRILESVDAAATVRAMGVSRERAAVVDEAAVRSVALELRAVRIGVDFWNRLNVAELVGLGAVLAVGFALVASGDATLGGATAAALFFHSLFGPIGQVLANVDELQKAQAALARLVGVFALPERALRARGSRTPAAVAFEGSASRTSDRMPRRRRSSTRPRPRSTA